MYHHQTHWSGCLISSFSLGNFLACLILILMLQPPLLISKKKKKKIQEQEQQQCGVTDEAEPFMGSGRFGNLILVYFSLFYPLLSSLLYIYDLPKLFLYHLIVMYMWQHELICWDIIVLMKRSWKLLCDFAEPTMGLSFGGFLYLACSEMAVNVKILLFGYWRLLGTMMFMHLEIT